MGNEQSAEAGGLPENPATSASALEEGRSPGRQATEIDRPHSNSVTGAESDSGAVEPQETSSLLGTVKSGVSKVKSGFAAAVFGNGKEENENEAKGDGGLGSWVKMPFGSSQSSKGGLGSIQESVQEAAAGISQTQQDPCPCLELTYMQRLTFFVIFFAGGCLMSLLSTMYVPTIAIAPSKFAVPYTLGNITSILAMSFLIGFHRQCKSMFDESRALASAVFLISMGLTLYCSFFLRSGIGTLACVIVQFCAYVYYCASYIPYGRSFLRGCTRKIIDCCCSF